MRYVGLSTFDGLASKPERSPGLRTLNLDKSAPSHCPTQNGEVRQSDLTKAGIRDPRNGCNRQTGIPSDAAAAAQY
jgi:hypothetical protein